MTESGYSYKKETFSKNGKKWEIEKTEVVTVANLHELKRVYTNIENDTDVFGGTPRKEFGACKLGAMSAKTFYSPNGKQKSRYSFN